MKNIKVIGFDADDTLWANESFYQYTEHKFCVLLKDYLPAEKISEELFKTEMQNLEIYGFGAKAFSLSLIETALRISNYTITASQINEIITLGKALINYPIELLEGVEEVLPVLTDKYKLVLITKGDLLDQQRKLNASGLGGYFHHIEILSTKEEKDYERLVKYFNIEASEFMMIGNSLKSDIVPALNIGSFGVYIPFHTTWLHEKMDPSQIQNNRFTQIGKITEVLKLLPIK